MPLTSAAAAGPRPFGVEVGVAPVSIVLIAFADELDVAELLRGDVRDQVVERTRALLVAEIEGLDV